jgi:hypothetical protein
MILLIGMFAFELVRIQMAIVDDRTPNIYQAKCAQLTHLILLVGLDDRAVVYISSGFGKMAVLQ